MKAASLNMLFDWPPAGAVFPVKSVRLRVLEGEHPFHCAERVAAAENWEREVARNPALFNGRMVFQNRVSFSDGVLNGEGHVIPYSTFLWWRKQAGGAGGVHIFGFPVLVSSDGALVAIRMSAHTANPGQVYCAAGSLDEDDIVDGYCDVEANMRREVLEETGFDLDRDAVADAQLYAAHRDGRVVLYRLFRFSLTGEEMAQAIRGRTDRDEEVEDAVVIRCADPRLHNYSPSMLPLLAWFFDREA